MNLKYVRSYPHSDWKQPYKPESPFDIFPVATAVLAIGLAVALVILIIINI